MNILNAIIENHGYVTSAELAELVKDYPNMPLVIKWGCSPRSVHPAHEVAAVIKNKMVLDKNEYAREVFLSASQLDTIRAALGLDKQA